MPVNDQSKHMEDPDIKGEIGQEALDSRAETLPVLPLRNIVFFPGQIMPLFVGRPSSVKLIEDAYRLQENVLVLTQRDSSLDLPKAEDLYQVGTVVRVVKIYTMPDGSKSVVVQGS